MSETQKGVNANEAAPLRVNVQRIVSHSFTDSEVQDMSLSCVPMAVQVRNILNSVGFRFEDDGKPSLIINHEPKPLGVMKCWRDEEALITHGASMLSPEIIARMTPEQRKWLSQQGNIVHTALFFDCGHLGWYNGLRDLAGLIPPPRVML